MPSHPRFLPIVRAAVGELGLVYGLPEESSREVTLAVDEALANIIRHAYKNRYDQPGASKVIIFCQRCGCACDHTAKSKHVQKTNSRMLMRFMFASMK
jgi:anti-sigma regulatory factor (Ser/Thr protein kinase)